MTSTVLAGLLLRQPFQPFRFILGANTEETGVGLRLEVRQALQGQGVKPSSTSPQPPSIDAERIPQNRRPRRTEGRLVSLRQPKYLGFVVCLVSSIPSDRRRRS